MFECLHEDVECEAVLRLLRTKLAEKKAGGPGEAADCPADWAEEDYDDMALDDPVDEVMERVTETLSDAELSTLCDLLERMRGGQT